MSNLILRARNEITDKVTVAARVRLGNEFIPSLAFSSAKEGDDDNDDEDVDRYFRGGEIYAARAIRYDDDFISVRVTFINNLSIFKGKNDAPACHLANETKSS